MQSLVRDVMLDVLLGLETVAAPRYLGILP